MFHLFQTRVETTVAKDKLLIVKMFCKENKISWLFRTMEFSGAKLLFFIVLPLRTGYIATVCGTERRYNWNSESLPDVPMYKIIGLNMHTKTSRMNSNHRACPRCILVTVRQ